jgi:hypothetical protein
MWHAWERGALVEKPETELGGCGYNWSWEDSFKGREVYSPNSG